MRGLSSGEHIGLGSFIFDQFTVFEVLHCGESLYAIIMSISFTAHSSFSPIRAFQVAKAYFDFRSVNPFSSICFNMVALCLLKRPCCALSWNFARKAFGHVFTILVVCSSSFCLYIYLSFFLSLSLSWLPGGKEPIIYLSFIFIFLRFFCSVYKQL